jgi:hypothetical protein
MRNLLHIYQLKIRVSILFWMHLPQNEAITFIHAVIYRDGTGIQKWFAP